MKKNTLRLTACLLIMIMLVPMLAACGQTGQQVAYTGETVLEEVDIAEEAIALIEEPALATDLMPVASGKLVASNTRAGIDYSNTADGYVMARFNGESAKKIKAQVKGPSGTTYTYNLTAGSETWTTFPLSDGSGSYKVTVYENTTGTKYATVLSTSFTAKLTDEFAPFLRPNQYVDYSDAPETVKKAAELTKDIEDPLEKVAAIYDFVVSELKYDKIKAKNVKSGYLPVLDTILSTKKGICFDYASLMAAMLRSQDVPCKLVVGYAGEAYHAWISVWSEETGWIDNVIYFDGRAWQRMDPTFASSGNQSAAIMKYIGDGKNYTDKYIY